MFDQKIYIFTFFETRKNQLETLLAMSIVLAGFDSTVAATERNASFLTVISQLGDLFKAVKSVCEACSLLHRVPFMIRRSGKNNKEKGNTLFCQRAG